MWVALGILAHAIVGTMKSTQILIDGVEAYPSMIRAIESAKTSIYFATFIMIKGTPFSWFEPALIAAAQRGVEVRILLDAYGSRRDNFAQLDELERSGAKVTWFRRFRRDHPLQYNHRMHKKLLIVDSRVGFTGGIGVAEVWTGYFRYPQPWRDTHFKLEGPVVAHLACSFAQSWNDWSEDKLVLNSVPTIPSFKAVNSSQPTRNVMPIAHELISLFGQARQNIRITTAYYGPPKYIRTALIGAAKRGVSIEILTNGPHATNKWAVASGRHLYGSLLAAGVRIYEYQPTNIHAKIFVIDDITVSIGSTNLNSRSMRTDEEFNLIIRDPALARKLNDQMDDDLKNAKEIELAKWSKRPVAERLNQGSSSFGRFFF